MIQVIKRVGPFGDIQRYDTYKSYSEYTIKTVLLKEIWASQ